MDESLMERLQKILPKARPVKAFNSVGNAYMYKPDFGGEKPTMFICGNDEEAKKRLPASSIPLAGKPKTWARRKPPGPLNHSVFFAVSPALSGVNGPTCFQVVETRA